MNATAESLEEVWADLRRGKPKPKRVYPDLANHLPALRNWLHNPDAPWRTIPGEGRREILKQLEEELPSGVVLRVESPWGRDAVLPSFIGAVRNLFIQPARRGRQAYEFPLPHPLHNPVGWDILWGLVARSSFIIEEPLRGMTDRRVSRLADVFRAVNEARFDAKESKNWHLVGEDIRTIGQWLEGRLQEHSFLSRALIRRPLGPDEQLDAILFLLTLAKQNQLIDETFIIIDNLERATFEDARHLSQLMSALTRWSVLGSPVHLIIGWDAANKGSLRKLNPGLSQLVREGMSWIP